MTWLEALPWALLIGGAIYALVRWLCAHQPRPRSTPRCDEEGVD